MIHEIHEAHEKGWRRKRAGGLIRWLRRLLWVGVGCVVLGFAVVLVIGRQLVAPAAAAVGVPPDFLGGEVVSIPSESGVTLSGWFTRKPDARGCILLLHAVRANRRSMADRARFLRDAGYHTLCIDFQAHGESGGKHITMGHLESMDAAAGVAYLREHYPELPVAVVGTSLGGASALMAHYQKPPEAMVVEAVFADVRTAVANRLEMRLGSGGRWLAPLLTCQIRPLLDIDPATLSPVLAAAKVQQPVFVIYGGADRHAKPAESQAIYAALAGPKQIWEITGAAHVDLHRFAKLEYEKRVSQFISSCLEPAAAD